MVPVEASINISEYEAGSSLLPTGRTARLITEDGRLVATSSTTITDDTVFGLVDTYRK